MTASFMQESAANVCLPATQASIVVPSGAASTAGVAGQSLATYVGKWLWFKSTVKTHVRVGATPTAAGAPTTGNIYLNADQDYFFRVPTDGTQSGIRVYGNGGAGVLHYAVTSGSE